MRLLVQLLGIVLVAATALIAPRADACINVTQADLDESVRNLKIAESSLEANDLANAKRWVQAAITFLDDAKANIDPKDGKVHSPGGSAIAPPDPRLYRRAARIRALLRARAPKPAATDREDAVKIFEKDVLGESPDPAALADYGEILSRVPERLAQATMILRALRDKDLIGSAFAYAALARIEKEAGNAEAERTARERCRTMAKKPAICAS
jgi:hypothetical protein